MVPAIFPCIFIHPSIVELLLLGAKIYRRWWSRGAAPADIKYSPALNMQGQIAIATTSSQLFIHMNNCLQFWYFVMGTREHDFTDGHNI